MQWVAGPFILEQKLPDITKKTGSNIMSCYFRHMKDVLDEAGIEVNKENKKYIERIIHKMMDVEYKNCSPTWKEVKENIKGNGKTRSRFIERLKESLRAL